MSDLEKNSRIIGEFMGGEFVDGEGKTEDRMYFEDNWYYMPLGYSKDWNSLMKVGDKMDKMIHDGNWGLFEQFFSDEMHGYDNFQKACAERNIEDANKWVLFFIEGINNQDPKHVKQAKEYNGN